VRQIENSLRISYNKGVATRADAPIPSTETHRGPPLTPVRRQTLAKLWQEFWQTYAGTLRAQQQLQQYPRLRDVARTNFALIVAAAARHHDVTDRVLLQLLPYADSTVNRQRGAWIHVDPALTGDVRTWYERKGWTRASDWPSVAEAILTFVQRCSKEPDDLAAACADFARLPVAKGFQTGTLTPILNALRPDDFALITNKSRRVLNYLTGAAFAQVLTDYPAANAALLNLLTDITDLLAERANIDSRPGDLFDLFCDWLVAIKKYSFRNARYWRIALDEDTPPWDAWRDGGFVAIDGGKLGDLTSLSRSEFTVQRDQWLIEHPEAKKRTLDQVWRFAHQIKEGDRIVAVDRAAVLGSGVVAGAYYFVPGAEDGHCLPVEWDDTTRRPLAQDGQHQTLVQISRAQFDALLQMPPAGQSEVPLPIRRKQPTILKETVEPYVTAPLAEQSFTRSPVESPVIFAINPPYLLTEVALQTAIDEPTLRHWTSAIQRKGQAIIYGPPGTGKTFLADHLARHLVGGGDGFVELVQFHPSYAYEDFVQGIRPQTVYGQLAYVVTPGRFLEFCAQAQRRQGPCVLIIDEINRANLARVFGELMVLLEYRERSIPLAGGGAPFAIPANVRLIGTMNTADRSLALVDHALRRRFAFLPLYPNYDVLRRFHERAETNFPIERLISVLEALNRQIGDKQYAVGIAFFLRSTLAAEIEDIWRMEIEPYLEEYFFDNGERIEEFRWQQVEGELQA